MMGNDLLSGFKGGDVLSGGKGADTIDGGNGNDVLKGRQGDDVLNGGYNSDIFALESLTGTDTINDFKDGVDLFGLTGSVGFSDLSISDSSNGVEIALPSNNNQILAIVNNVSAVDITVDDFTTI